MDFDYQIFVNALPALFMGALITAKLTILGIVAGSVLGLIVGIARTASNPFIRNIALGYVIVVRGVPLLMTLLFLYYGLPSAGIVLDAFVVAIIALGINNAAYIAEIVRAGIQSIDRGQMRAARSLGMSHMRAMRRIILPQAIRRVLPPITNEYITLLKNTSLVSVIAISDLLRSGVEVMTWTANTFSPFAGVALLYLAMTLPLSAMNARLEAKYHVT